ncbi:MAG: putative ABC transporter permease [Lachnospiraceae bacterium]|nr:putative ABC transporter permease [Lachnospiraceae bacterium]
MIISSYFIRFIIFSFMGWIYECTYCTVKTGHWENRGFLFGPICPIYGVGATITMIIFNELPFFTGGETIWWKIFLVCAIGSAILEYSVSYVLEKRFHAMWWDYSQVPLNVNGRICLPATLSFGVAGVVIVKWFFPWILQYFAMGDAHPVINEIISLALMMVLGMDLALTVASLTSLLRVLDEAQDKFDERMEASVEKVASAPAMIKEKVSEAPEAIMAKVSEAPEAIMAKVSEAPGMLRAKAADMMKLTRRQKRHLHTITTFKDVKHAKLVERLRREEHDS